MSLTALAQKLKLDKNSVHHRVRRAIERGYLVNREEKRGMPAKIAIADPLPDEIEFLPDLEPLECWSSDEGVKEEDSQEDASKPDGPLLPLNQHSNTPTPPVPSDYAAQGLPTNGNGSERGDDPGPIPESLRRWPPALGPAADDVFDIDLRWRPPTLSASSSVGRQ